MNLEEVINQEREKAEEGMKKSIELFPSFEGRKCMESAEEHEQLADWLEELKELRKHKEKYRWHDLRKNPDDLPDANYPSNTWFEVVQKDNEEELPRAAMQYDDELGFGFYHDIFDPVSSGYVDTEFTTAAEEGLAEVVAWREIEEFESEEEDED